jgi:hypothetical protein
VCPSRQPVSGKLDLGQDLSNLRRLGARINLTVLPQCYLVSLKYLYFGPTLINYCAAGSSRLAFPFC